MNPKLTNKPKGIKSEHMNMKETVNTPNEYLSGSSNSGSSALQFASYWESSSISLLNIFFIWWTTDFGWIADKRTITIASIITSFVRLLIVQYARYWDLEISD